ncbi:MAG: hypothetical protein ACK5PS_16285 [Desulfopila sp.]
MNSYCISGDYQQCHHLNTFMVHAREERESRSSPPYIPPAAREKN